ESTVELGRIDQSITPVRAPRSANCPARATRTLGCRRSGVDRPAVVESQLLRMVRVREVDDIHTALIPALRHDVAARNRNQSSVVQNAVFLRRLRRGDLEIRVLGELPLRIDG